MLGKIQSAFLQTVTNTCHEERVEQLFGVMDDREGQKAYIKLIDPPTWNFTVENLSHEPVYFIAIDNCIFIYPAYNKQRCDFALFNESDFCFVEIKKTISRTQSHKQDAREQLRETIKEFKAVIDFTGYNVSAIISWLYNPPVMVSASRMQAVVQFWDDYHVNFMEGNKFQFS